MEALIILLFVVIIVMILTLQNKILQRLDRMEKDLGQLWEQFSHFVSIAKNARDSSSAEKPGATEPMRPIPTPSPVKPPAETEPFTAKVRAGAYMVQSPPPQAIKAATKNPGPTWRNSSARIWSTRSV